MSGNFDPRAYQRLRRANAIAAGLCVQCCKAATLPGRSRCQACRDYQHAYTGKSVSDDGRRSCSSCNETGHTRNTCPLEVAHYVAPPAGEWCDECLSSGFHRVGCMVKPEGSKYVLSNRDYVRDYMRERRHAEKQAA